MSWPEVVVYSVLIVCVFTFFIIVVLKGGKENTRIGGSVDRIELPLWTTTTTTTYADPDKDTKEKEKNE